jgi:hypothetical protein
MKRQNEYENAFALWLEDNDLCYKRTKQSSRLRIGEISVKSFDFLINADSGTYIVELKGRVFKGKSLENLCGLQNWATNDDIQSLCAWQSIDGLDGAFIVFAYRIEDYLAELDGNNSIEYNGKIYAFLAIDAEDYRHNMKTRSLRWNTVDLKQQDFRALVKRVSDVFS